MNHFKNENDIIALIAEAVHAEAEDHGDHYNFLIQRRQQAFNLHITKIQVEDILRSISSLEVHDETSLISDNSYEIIVREESDIPVRRFSSEKIEVQNEESGLKYELSFASDAYFIWLLAEMRRKLDHFDMPRSFSMPARADRYIEQEPMPQVIEYLRMSSFRFITLKINSSRKISPASFSKLTHAFLFHLGYNLDVAFVPQRLIEEIVRHGRISRMRRSKVEDLDPPRRTYNEDLVQHYLLAVSTENPVIQYLSYYHIFEHFFETVFNQDLVDTIKGKITDPGFSYKRTKDINLLIGTIKKSLQIRSETITFSEYEALRLCVSRFVNIDDLRGKLEEYDENIVNFYKSNEVSFSKGVAIDLYSNDTEDLIKKLTKRIYTTRNALVHSKESEKSKFTPFRDDRDLVKEVPLLRFAAEMVVLSDSGLQ